MRLKIRTVFALTIFAAIASVTGVLMTISLTGAVRTSMDFAKRFTSEQALGGLHAVEHLILDSERILNTESIVIREQARSPDLLDKVAEFWIAYRKLTAHSHSAMAFILKQSGEGVICDRDGNVDLITKGGPTGLEAVRHSTKAKRPITDLRQFSWFQQALLEKKLVVGEFHGFKSSWHEGKTRGINVSMPVPDPERNGESLGVLAIDISTEWVGEYLENAMKRSIAKSEAFVIERGKDGRIVVIAHTDHDIDTIAMMAGNDGLIHPEDLSDPLLSEAVYNIHYSAAFIENASPSLREIRSLKGNYIATFMNVLPGRNPPWAICFLVSTDDLLAPLWGRLVFNLSVIFATVVLSVALATWVSFRIARPIEAVTSAAREMGEMRFEAKDAPVRSTITEVDDLAKATDSMRSGMKAFMQYIPEEILRRYLKPGTKAETDGEVTRVTILFTDIRDFSSITESSDPLPLVRQLNEYLEILSKVISRHEGTVDKYIGDSVMAFWNAPGRVPLHARQAFATVLSGRMALDEARERWALEKLPAFHTRMGIHTGEVIVGNIGSSVRLNYTIIGDAVNLASRLESLNKQYGTSILVSEPARLEAGDDFLTRPVDLVAVKGKTEPILVHELIGWRADCSPDQVDLAAMTTLAHDAYRVRRFSDARDAYAAILARWIHDGVSQRMMERADELSRVPPPANWSGVHRTPLK